LTAHLLASAGQAAHRDALWDVLIALLPMGFVALVIIVLAVVVRLSFLRKSRALLQRWADRNAYEILATKRKRAAWTDPLLFCTTDHPYSWTSPNQVVFRVTIQDGAGRTRRGHVRIGGFFAGVLSDKVSVVWDAERPRRT
jgi:hypothetical protein